MDSLVLRTLRIYFSHRLENYFLEHYDKPIFEAGIQLKDKVYLKMDLGAV